jgi:hypothetical protein
MGRHGRKGDSDRGEGSTLTSRKLLDGSSLVGFAADVKIGRVRVEGGLEASLRIVIVCTTRLVNGRVG